MSTLPLDRLGGRQTGRTTLSFGVLLPWVTPGNGQSVGVLVIHERDQFLQHVPALPVTMAHSVDPDYGDYWSGDVDVSAPTALPADAHWGRPGRYVYRLVVTRSDGSHIDWVIDPCAREFAAGKQSAVLLGATPYAWLPSDATWRVPALYDLILMEINLAEFAVDVSGAIDRLDYVRDLGVNGLSVMPVSNIASQVDWGYLPVGYFGVDERFGGGDAFKSLVDQAHARGIAILVDSVYGHANRCLFAYQYVYDQLGYDENPFMGPFAKDYFAAQGASTDFTRTITRDFFLAVNQHWLEEFHVDGFRYDCVPNYWDGPTGVGYSKLVCDTRALVVARLGQGRLARFGAAAAPTLVQCAEQLEDPVGVLWQSYSDTTWQDGTLNAARAVAHSADGALDTFASTLGLDGFPTEVTINGATMPRTALQYLESHDHSRLLAEFGVVQPDEAGNYLFLAGDRSNWYRLQPYLIAMLAAKGIPMLFEGEELAEDLTLPGNGLGRISLLRPVNWDYFYDTPGRSLVTLVREMLSLRRERAELRSPNFFYYRGYQDDGLLIYHRTLGTTATVVAVNVTDTDHTVELTFPRAGQWTSRLPGGSDLNAHPATTVTIPSNYGCVWTLSA